MTDRRDPIDETNGDDDQIQQEEQQQLNKKKKKQKEKEKKDGYKRKLRGAKNLILHPFRKFEKAYEERKKKPPPPPFPYSEDFGKSCFFCFVHAKAHPNLPTRPDPDAKTSSYHGFLRSLIERNDFYSPECNVHIEKKK